MAFLSQGIRLVLILILATLSAPKKVHLGHLYFRLDSLQSCSYNRNSMEFKNMTRVTYGPHDNFINGDILINRELSQTKFLLKINRCPSSVASSCELLQTWTFHKESCSVMLQRDMPWAGIFHRMTPRMECPIKKGKYSLQNGTVLLEFIRHLPFRLENIYWRVNGDSYDDKGFFGCYEVLGSVIRARN